MPRKETRILDRAGNHLMPFPNQKSRQHGAVLFLAMVFLVLISILAITASNTSIMQERMTGGLRNRQLGLMGVETALRGGEEFLWNLTFNFQQPLPPCVYVDQVDCVYTIAGRAVLNAKVQRFRTSKEWLDPSADGARPYGRALSAFTGDSISANLAAEPRFIIEYLGLSGPTQVGLAGSRGRTGAAVLQQNASRVGEHHLYRITARSQGGTGAVVRVAESIFVAMNLTNSNFNPDPP